MVPLKIFGTCTEIIDPKNRKTKIRGPESLPIDFFPANNFIDNIDVQQLISTKKTQLKNFGNDSSSISLPKLVQGLGGELNIEKLEEIRKDKENK